MQQETKKIRLILRVLVESWLLALREECYHFRNKNTKRLSYPSRCIQMYQILIGFPVIFLFKSIWEDHGRSRSIWTVLCFPLGLDLSYDHHGVVTSVGTDRPFTFLEKQDRNNTSGWHTSAAEFQPPRVAASLTWLNSAPCMVGCILDLRWWNVKNPYPVILSYGWRMVKMNIPILITLWSFFVDLWIARPLTWMEHLRFFNTFQCPGQIRWNYLKSRLSCRGCYSQVFVSPV